MKNLYCGTYKSVFLSQLYFKKISVSQQWLHIRITWGTFQFHSVHLLSHVWLFVTSWTASHQASLSITNSQSLLKLMSMESVMPSYHLILWRPLLLLPSVFPSIRVFSSESVLCSRWPKYWTFSFSISPSNEYSGLIPFRIDWFDPLAVQGTLKGLLQHHSLKSINSVALSFLYNSTLTSIHNYQKNQELLKTYKCQGPSQEIWTSYQVWSVWQRF